MARNIDEFFILILVNLDSWSFPQFVRKPDYPSGMFGRSSLRALKDEALDKSLNFNLCRQSCMPLTNFSFKPETSFTLRWIQL
jgi:hypothetical protein